MIRWAAYYFRSIPPVFVDGSLFVSLGMLTPIMAGVSSDDAAKWISPQLLFWCKTIVLPAINGFILSLKMFRSTEYSDHRDEKRRQNGTQQIYKDTADLMK